MTNSFFVRQNTCPTCNYSMDAAGTVDGSPLMPEPGDAVICFNCGEILEFDKHMKLNLISKAELNKMQSQDPETYFDLIQAQGVVREMRKAKGEVS